MTKYFRYVYIYYLPSGLFVCVSWASFTIPPEVVPGRMCLLATLFLALTNIFNTITNTSPNVDGTTAMKSWMIACILFVFFALLEYASILYFLMVSPIKVLSLKPLFLNFKSCRIDINNNSISLNNNNRVQCHFLLTIFLDKDQTGSSKNQLS